MLRTAPRASPSPRGDLSRGHAPRPGARRGLDLLRRPVAAAASTDLLTALTTDAAYLGLASSFVAVSGWPLLSSKKGGEGLGSVDLATTADATRRTPRPAWVLSTILSFLPLINFSAWLLLMVTEGSKPRYWLCAALYALPFIVTAVGGPGGDALALEAAALCAIHLQVERVVLAAADARVLKAEEAEGVPEEAEDGGRWLAVAAQEELASFDARLGARLAKGDRLRSLAAAARVPRARSGRVGEVSAALEAAVAGVAPVAAAAALVPPPGASGRAVVAAASLEQDDSAAHLSSVRAELIAEAQAALAKAGKGRRRRRRAEEDGGGES